MERLKLKGTVWNWLKWTQFSQFPACSWDWRSHFMVKNVRRGCPDDSGQTGETTFFDSWKLGIFWFQPNFSACPSHISIIPIPIKLFFFRMGKRKANYLTKFPFAHLKIVAVIFPQRLSKSTWSLNGYYGDQTKDIWSTLMSETLKFPYSIPPPNF